MLRASTPQFYVQSGVTDALGRGRAVALICWQMAFHYPFSGMVPGAKKKKGSGTKMRRAYKSSSAGILQRFPLSICLMCSDSVIVLFSPNTVIIKEFETAAQRGTIELELCLRRHL